MWILSSFAVVTSFMRRVKRNDLFGVKRYQTRNPPRALNKIGVEAVEVFVPSPLLSSGMCLVDTPGIGSVFAGNTMTTREFVPHVDAAIVVLGARVQNDLIERVRESRRRFEAEIRARLSEAVRSATSALERAKARRAEGDASVAAEVRRLQEWRLRARQTGAAG